jgi:hypothetical protein
MNISHMIHALACGAAILAAGCGGSQIGASQNEALAPPPLNRNAFAPLNREPKARAKRRYKFQTLDNPADTTYNVLTGISNTGVISGYYGNGSSGHPNQGYTLAPPYGASDYMSEDYPNAMQTQVSAIDNLGNTDGSYENAHAKWHGFVKWKGVFKSLSFTPYGLNDAGVTVQTTYHFTQEQQYVSKVFVVNTQTGKQKLVSKSSTDLPGGNLGTGLNAKSDVVGYYESVFATGWAVIGGNSFSVNGYRCTYPAGINDGDEIVGSYSSPTTFCLGYYNGYHGFVLTGVPRDPTYKTVDDPKGVGGTMISAVNDSGQVVGTYVDGSGNTHGFLATPR